MIRIDSRKSPADQLYAFAHECGHLLFGHYEIDGEVWTMTTGPGTDEWEAEADFFAQFATRTPGHPGRVVHRWAAEAEGLIFRDR